ncbi:hypothetical protein M378DRAFT_164880 [Amanita muscaria Koide BX008]|uniref:Uncharacterized protein n=1 Tax=Amanita muscaria (strain Koide BX008) TaxID=946122 RepID=A0A0C2X390_AMAMK|nr:hypothetical protein M378DRAFT_164880 [Amanita muscaria Koide BX008]
MKSKYWPLAPIIPHHTMLPVAHPVPKDCFFTASSILRYAPNETFTFHLSSMCAR